MNYLKKYMQEVAIYFGVVLIGLVIFNGWTPGKTLGSYDLVSGHAMTAARFVANDGFYNSIYDFYISGGSAVAPIQGILPIQELLLAISSSPFFILNMTALILLLLNGLVLRGLYKETYQFVIGEKANISIYFDFILAGILIFMPAMGWRINHGHLNILNGVIAYVLCLYVPLKIYNESFSFRSFALVALSLAHVLPYSSFQMVAYALFFSLPIFLYLCFQIIKDKKFSQVHWGVGSLVVGVLISSPVVYMMFSYFLGGTSERGVSDKKIFTYLRPSFDYLVSSLSLSREAIPQKYPPFSHHEINYPLTYTFLVTFAYSVFVAIKNKKNLIYPVILTNIFILMFCFNIFGLTDGITGAVSLLGAFRVPYRALIFLTINILISILVLVNSSKDEIGAKEAGVIFGVGLISLLVPAMVLEILAVVLLVVVFFTQHMKIIKITPLALALFFVLSLKGFSDRLTDMEDIDKINQSLSQAKSVEGLNGDKLYKTLNYFPLSKMGSNALTFNNTSVVNGYWHPNSNFNKAYSYIFGLPNESSRLSFKIDINSPFYPTFQTFYAIQNVIYVQKGKPGIQIMKKDGLKNIWSPTTIMKTGDERNIFNALRNKGGSLINDFDTNVYLTSKQSLTKARFSKCQSAKIDGIYKGELRISLAAKEDCLIVLPINYSALLEAKSDNGTVAKVFKANGSLAGIEVPAGSSKLNIKGVMKVPMVLTIFKILGYLGLMALLIFEIRSSLAGKDSKEQHS